MKRTLRNKVLVIIGGTTGLGLSAAQACADDGARLVLVGRSAQSANNAGRLLGDAALPYPGDAVDPQCAAAAIELARSRFGGFHGLYHVAGGSGRQLGDGPLHELTDAGIRNTLDLNLASILYSNRAAVQAFLSQNTGGVVLNMGSVLGFSPAPHFFSTHVYSAAKAAIIGMTKAAAAYYAKHGIRLNVVAPALVDTPMARRAAEDENIQRYIATKQPLDGGRIGRSEDLDDAVVYLLSDRSRFMTGQVLTIDGGWSVSEGQIPHE
jgi:NAD(P)-dependent dehydrogenase (short-subunit alcohol dehydrogenase family)